MQLISSKEDLIRNIQVVEKYLTEGSDSERQEMLSIIKRGICFVAYNAGNEVRFAPSKFIGYKNIQLSKYVPKDLDGRDTTAKLTNIFGFRPARNKQIEQNYKDFFSNIGLSFNKTGSYGSDRKFWILDIETEFEADTNVSGEFPEGKLIERMHMGRERNSKVIELAKQLFKTKHGRLFCQVCGFDFEEVYGTLGRDFIEAHHTIAVCDMKPGHKTKPDEIAMLCPNCHRMVHKKRPWLTMNQLNQLLKLK